MLLRRRTRRWTSLLGVLVLAACHDAAAPKVLTPPDPSKLIVDGAHNNGNDDVFFLPPLVADPTGQPGFGDAVQPGLPVTIKIACWQTAQPPYAPSACTPQTFTPSMVKFTTDGFYMVNWDTKSPGVDPGDVFRIQVLVGSKMIAFADVFMVPNANPKNIATQGDIPLPDGRTLPIKVRIEQGWNCDNRTNKAACVTQVVSTTSTTPTLVTSGTAAALFQPGTFAQDVIVTIQDATQTLQSQNKTCQNPGTTGTLTTMLVSSECVHFTIDPVIPIQKPVQVAVCVEIPHHDPSDPLLNSEQLIKYDDNEQVFFLRNVPPPITCPPEPTTTTTSAIQSSGGALGYAVGALRSVGRALKQFVSVTPAYALHLGIGGEIGLDNGGFSYISVGRAMTIAASTGDQQSAPAGQSVDGPTVTISTLHQGVAPSGQIAQIVGVPGQQVKCEILTGGGSFDGGVGSPTVVVTGTDGVAHCPRWILGITPGPNTMQAVALGINNNTFAVEDVPTVLAAGNAAATTIQKIPLVNTVVFHATGTNVYFSDGFETVLPWTTGATSFWNLNGLGAAQPAVTNTNYPTYVGLAPNDNSNGVLPVPFSGAMATWFGQTATGSYLGAHNTGDAAGSGGTSTTRNTGSFNSPTFAIPAGAKNVTLEFDTWWEIESVNPSTFDLMQIALMDMATGAVTQLGQLNPTSDPQTTFNRASHPYTSGGFDVPPAWQHISTDVSAFAGKNVQVVFTFDTRDQLYNGFRGWVVDNVVVKVPASAATNAANASRASSSWLNMDVTTSSAPSGLNPITAPVPRTP